MNPELLAELVAQVLAHTRADNGHLIWTSQTNRSGVPVLRRSGQEHMVRRIMHEHLHGRPPEGIVRRTCQVPECIRHMSDTRTRQQERLLLRAVRGLDAPVETCGAGHVGEIRLDPHGNSYCEACSREARARYVARNATGADA